MFSRIPAQFSSSAPRSLSLASKASVWSAVQRRHSSGSNMHNNDPDTIDREVKRTIKTEESVHSHAPGWNETLASESEANVKAEKHDGAPSVEATLTHIKNHHHAEKHATGPTGSEDAVKADRGESKDPLA